jgi:hypothetical protein
LIMQLTGLDSLVAKLKARAEKTQREANAAVIVGYTASYAIFVHEDMEAVHPVGQAKFLEQPARTMAKELGRQIGEAKKRGVELPQALLLAGLRLQRESQLLCPVDTGALRASAFTRLEGGG